MKATHLLEHLNPAQEQAVSSPPCHQLILAGAGSGKTRVLVHRIAWLIQQEGVSPYSILAVTFTNKAAREMRGRIEELLGTNPRGMWVGTFHGLAHRLLQAHWSEAGLAQNFQVIDSDDQLRLIKRVYGVLNVDEKRWPARLAAGYINGHKDEGRRARHVLESADLYERTMLAVYREYEETCNRGSLVDFGELLLRAHELWLNRPELLHHYQQRFPFILVDEFQDTNTIQYAWLRVLAGDQCWVTAVGDDDQSIYGWRGARIENIQQFDRDFPGTQIVRLEQNYRSTGTILRAANGVISNNFGRLGKTLRTDGEDGEPISLYAGFNEQDEARFIVDQISRWASQGNRRDSVAILYRSNAQSRVLEEALLREGVPYRIYGGQRFYDRLEIRNVLAYLRLMVNRDDDAALERIINTPTRGIGGKTLEDMRLFARDQGCSLWAASGLMLKNNVLSKRAASSLFAFRELIDNLGQYTEEPLHDLAERVIHQSGLLEFHSKEKGEKGQARKENLEELVSACRSFVGEDEELDPLTEFLAQAALDAGEEQADEFEDAIQLMTLHSAKGLEFPLVFIAGVEENLFPHKMSVEDPDRLEEERRLAYVGITRAMRKLVLTYAETRRIHGKESFNSVSRFVREIPSDCLQEVRIKAAVARPASFQSRPATRRLSDQPVELGLSLGQRVIHPVFGEGVILHCEGSGPNSRIHINFDDVGSKVLTAQYAKLQPA
ncbi:DNA helicase II [Halioxenophilus sp. WMMB6]|uniref:DNA helicase II n=1 Tax=Halioxenophilus sp. WMMB6 TaxID=3073815 RepID=UPI00295E5A3C|nr:DNA helicase II [Halioxenophilus sp. WMMB6]